MKDNKNGQSGKNNPTGQQNKENKSNIPNPEKDGKVSKKTNTSVEDKDDKQVEDRTERREDEHPHEYETIVAEKSNNAPKNQKKQINPTGKETGGNKGNVSTPKKDKNDYGRTRTPIDNEETTQIGDDDQEDNERSGDDETSVVEQENNGRVSYE